MQSTYHPSIQFLVSSYPLLHLHMHYVNYCRYHDFGLMYNSDGTLSKNYQARELLVSSSIIQQSPQPALFYCRFSLGVRNISLFRKCQLPAYFNNAKTTQNWMHIRDEAYYAQNFTYYFQEFPQKGSHYSFFIIIPSLLFHNNAQHEIM